MALTYIEFLRLRREEEAMSYRKIATRRLSDLPHTTYPIQGRDILFGWSPDEEGRSDEKTRVVETPEVGEKGVLEQPETSSEAGLAIPPKRRALDLG